MISHLENQYLQAGNCHRRLKLEHPRLTTVCEESYLANVAKRHHFQSAVKLNAELQRVTGRRISTKTVSNRLH